MDKKSYIQKIQKNFSDLKFQQAKLIRSGYDSDIIVLDKTIVFLFPKPKLDCREKLQRQLKMVPLLNKKITLSIPNFIYISKDKSFAGYEYIDGTPLSKEIIKGMTTKEKEQCAKQIANFINELHAFSVQTAKRKGVNIDKEIKNQENKQVVVHRDLIDEHIIFNKRKKKIVGIIDFGDLIIADPALEFSRIWRYGEQFLDLILKYYKTTDKEIKKRSKFLWLASKGHK